jgi:predicted CXXCH cytochrome family protein
LKQLFLLFLAGGAAWSAAPFSHRVHLQTGLACTECHRAAASSTKAQDNLLPSRTVCLGCHTDGELPAIPGKPATLVNQFSHALHLKLGNVAPYLAKAIDTKNYLQPPDDIRRHLNTNNPCEACHRGLEESDQVTHAAMPKMADCLVCHSNIENPFTCENCHVKNAAFLKPASHVEHFLDLHSTGKMHLDKTTCAVCHGREFTCMGCH